MRPGCSAWWLAAAVREARGKGRRRAAHLELVDTRAVAHRAAQPLVLDLDGLELRLQLGLPRHAVGL